MLFAQLEGFVGEVAHRLGQILYNSNLVNILERGDTYIFVKGILLCASSIYTTELVSCH